MGMEISQSSPKEEKAGRGLSEKMHGLLDFDGRSCGGLLRGLQGLFRRISRGQNPATTGATKSKVLNLSSPRPLISEVIMISSMVLPGPSAPFRLEKPCDLDGQEHCAVPQLTQS